jgi:energy-converting hydrogenase Eha subunit H
MCASSLADWIAVCVCASDAVGAIVKTNDDADSDNKEVRRMMRCFILIAAATTIDDSGDDLFSWLLFIKYVSRSNLLIGAACWLLWYLQHELDTIHPPLDTIV